MSLIGYTSLGYACRDLPAVEDRLTGRTAIVTGATSGLGRSTATELARLGASVLVVGRDASKTDAIAQAIRGETHNERVRAEVADLSLMSEIRLLAARIEAPVHILVNNAGVLLPDRRETAEGIETCFATNLLGHFLLTNLLIPKLAAAGSARIVNVSSGGMYTQRIAVDDLQSVKGPYNGAKTYARTKRGQVILTELWAEALAARGIVVHAMHPGWADTPGVAKSLPGFYQIMKPLLRTAAQGADTIVWLCAAPEPLQSTGRFWHDRKPRPTHRWAKTRETAEERAALWDALCHHSGWSGTLESLAVPSNENP